MTFYDIGVWAKALQPMLGHLLPLVYPQGMIVACIIPHWRRSKQKTTSLIIECCWMKQRSPTLGIVGMRWFVLFAHLMSRWILTIASGTLEFSRFRKLLEHGVSDISLKNNVIVARRKMFSNVYDKSKTYITKLISKRMFNTFKLAVKHCSTFCN